ncbi:MAG: hypothetical protein KC483_10865 [Nitrosarchaeum sp.]|nr:hypothetical protein [Nitrosarchaeum sp.]
MVKEERSEGRRDHRLSFFHRLAGSGCYATDVDFIELNSSGEPIALFEFKHCNAPPIHPHKSFQLSALKRLAQIAKIPAYGIRYNDFFDWFYVYDFFHHDPTLPREMDRLEVLYFIAQLHGHVMTNQEIEIAKNVQFDENGYLDLLNDQFVGKF